MLSTQPSIMTAALMLILVGCGGGNQPPNGGNALLPPPPVCPSYAQTIELDPNSPTGLDFTMTASGAEFTFQVPESQEINLRVCFGQIDVIEQQFPEFEGVIRLSQVYELRGFALNARVQGVRNSLKNLLPRKMKMEFSTTQFTGNNITTDLKYFILTENGLLEEHLGNFTFFPGTRSGEGKPLVNEDGFYFIGFRITSAPPP